MLGELNRRKVLRTVGAYAVVVFVILQLMDAAVEPLRLPEWVPTVVVLALILGFPIVFMLAWVLDVTPEGVRRSPAGQLTRGQAAGLFSAMLALTAGLGYGFYHYYSGVFAADPRAIPMQTEAAAPGRNFQAPENSVAVLPFADLSASGDQQFFGDGIAEEILNLLAQVDDLRVAARTSSFSFQGEERNIREIGALLNVRTVLEGSVRTDGNNIRLTAQLINAEDGFHIWSSTYQREATDLFALQDEVASEIASALVENFDGLSTPQAGRRADTVQAALKYREGRLHWWRRTPEEIETAISLFGESLQEDPFFAPACAALADSWLLLSSYGNITPMEANDKALPLIEHALELDPESPEAFASLGLARWQIGQLGAAESALRHAISLNEDYIPAQLWLAGLLGDQGRWGEQSLVLERAMQLDPVNELLAINYANNLAIRGRAGEARELLARLVAVRPDSTTLLNSMAPLAARAGDLVEAWHYARDAWELDPDNPGTIKAMSDAWMYLDEYSEAETLLRGGLAESDQNFNLLFGLIQLHLIQGQFEEARSMLRERFGDRLEQLPDQLRGGIRAQQGLLYFAEGDPAGGLVAFEEALTALPDEGVNNLRKVVVTMAAAAAQRSGKPDRAAELAAIAERSLKRERLNGVDDANMYYEEAALAAVRGQVEPALDALESAYERGWRHLWLVRLDMRLDSLRDEPRFIEVRAQIAEDVATARSEVEGQYLAGS